MEWTERYPSQLESKWYRRSPVLILIVGVLLALVVAPLLMLLLMQPPLDEVRALILTLGATSLFSVGLSYLLYRRGWARSTSLWRTLVLTYVLAALLTLINVGVMQQQMFVSQHDLVLSTVLLLFAGIIATSFGMFVAASVTADLRQVAGTARQLADGDLAARVAVHGRDEIAQVGAAFNRMAAQLQTAEQERAELDQLRRDLIAWTSHDLRTPLTGIRVRTEALQDGVVETEAMRERYYREIHADVLALNHLIDDLFELAQLDAGSLELEMSGHALSDIVSDSLERFRTLAEQKQIALWGEVAPDVDPVQLNAAKISRVLDNLIGNALRYTPEDGRVEVQAVRADGRVRVTVSDTGPGFAPQDLPRVFEQFYRGEQARSRATGGAGLGLAIVRGIVAAHNGRVWAENRPGGGAVVGFELPG